MIKRWVEGTNPQKLLVDYYPYTGDNNPAPYYLEAGFYQDILQDCSIRDPEFYYCIQAFGWKDSSDTSKWRWWRQPNAAELKAATYMPLAHGAKGIIFQKYYNGRKWEEDPFDKNYKIQEINLVDNEIPHQYNPNPLWYIIKNDIVPKLKGVFGDTLQNLNYTRKYCNYINNGISPLESSSYHYISFTKDPTPIYDQYYFHAGLFEHNQNRDDYYFLALNALRENKSITINLTPPVSGYKNLRFRNIEGGIDTTFYQSFEYDITFSAGEGYLFQVSPVIKYGGKLIYSETISSPETLNDELIIYSGDTLKIQSEYTILDTIIIKSGGTLYMDEGSVLNLANYGNIEVESGGSFIIKQGAELYFYNSLPLTVNGTLNAQGVYGDSIIFTSGGSSGTWGSIKFDGSASSNSILNYVKITYATDIQCLNSANVTIQNSRIQNCTEGIYIYNAEPGIYSNSIIDPLHNGINASGSGYEVEILDNTIVKNSSNPEYKEYQGIFIQSSMEGYLGHNDISGFNYGIYFGGGSYGYFFDKELNAPYPNNRVVNSYRGVGVGWGSYFIGGIDETAGNNTIMNNTVNDFYVYQGSTAYAEFNYWGGGEGNNYVDGSSELYDDFYLDEDPWGESYQMLALGSTNNELLSALQSEQSNNVSQSVNYYKQMIIRNSHPAFSVTRLTVLKRKHNIGSLQEYLVNLLDGNRPYKPVILNLLAGLALNSGSYNQAVNHYNTIIQNYPDSYHSVNARFEKFFAALNYTKDDSTASQILSEIQALNLNDEEYLMRLASAEDLLDRFNGSQNLNKSDNSPKVTTEENLPKEYNLSQNYPNPFNPATTINYQIPKDGKVILKIYDILGNEVKTLVDEYKTTGRYTVEFDGNNLASGIYIYRIQAGEYTASKKMTLIK